MEQDDPVVCEIPVHLADSLREHVYMVQYPLRPSYRPMPNAPRGARLKPTNQMLQLDFAVDQQSEHFDRDAEDYLKQKHIRLQSSSVPALTNYAVAVFRHGQLHLTPMTAILQMRPSLAHIDDAVDEEEDEEMEMAQEETKEPEEETKEVQFQFKKKQSERAINAIQSSYAYKKQQMNAEHWVELQVNDKNSAAADSEFENLFSERDEDVVSDMTTAEYLAALRYRSKAKTVSPSLAAVVDSTTDEAEEKHDVASSAAATSTPVLPTDAVQKELLQILMTDHITHFDTLLPLLPTRTEEEVIAALQHVAVSVEGRLLPRSAMFCRGESAISVRKNILQELATSSSGVSRADLTQKFGLDPDATKKILESVATLDSATRTWSFKIDEDDSFAMRFPAVAKVIKL